MQNKHSMTELQPSPESGHYIRVNNKNKRFSSRMKMDTEIFILYIKSHYFMYNIIFTLSKNLQPKKNN